ncbi:arginine-ornithine antiporter [Apilactobacillus xinyiensis]|uniref:arginine-ornithine antiporter n=1 Tax=Apilactobacillus xinyiensis TaxID=2841032 RepID=UPI003364F4FC
MSRSKKKLSLLELVGLVMGSIIGGGVFNLMHDMAMNAGIGAIIIGWIITCIGMLSLAFSFQNLTMKRPDLQAGIYSYAEAGFGKYMGFNAAWGYWLSVLLGNVSYATLLMSAMGYFFPIFGNGQNIYSIIVASCFLWGCHFMILKGVESASFVNTIITITKLVPLFLFILILIVSFKMNVFTSDFWLTSSGHFEFGSVLQQVKSTMLVTIWVFAGIEGAVVFSSSARSRKDIGRATVLGIVIIALLYMLVTILSFGVMKQAQLANLPQPAMGYLLQSMVGKWGAILVNFGLIVSVIGAWLSWTMFAGELPYEASKVGTFPKIFSKENKNGAPINSLIFTNVVIELFMLSFLFADKAYNFFFSVASSASLIPYAFSSFYQVKYSLQNRFDHRKKNIFIGILSSIYSIWLIYAAGINYLLLTMLLFACGIPVYYYLQKNDNNSMKVFTSSEKISALILLCLGLCGLIGLVFGFVKLG